MRKGLIWAGVAILIAGATYYGVQQYRIIKKLCYKLGGYRLISLNPVTIGMELTVINKDRFVARVRRIKVKLYAGGTYVGTVISKRNVDIAPDSETAIPLEVSFAFKEAVNTLAHFKQAVITAKGNILVNKFGLPISIPIDETFRLAEISGGRKKKSC